MDRLISLVESLWKLPACHQFAMIGQNYIVFQQVLEKKDAILYRVRIAGRIWIKWWIIA